MIAVRASESAWRALLGAIYPRCSGCGQPAEWRQRGGSCAWCTACAAQRRDPIHPLDHATVIAEIQDRLLRAAGV